MRRRLLCLALAAVAALAACRTAPVRRPAAAPPEAARPWPERRAELQQRPHYAVKGRVAVATGGEGFNARLRWVQDGPRVQMSLEGPLGAGGVQVTEEGGALSIVTSRGEHLGDEQARAELAAHLGFEPPLSSLRYWMLGVPDPGQPAAEVLDGQRLSHLEQGGWQIDYPAYLPAGGQSLPAKITLQRAGVRVRLLVDTWSD